MEVSLGRYVMRRLAQSVVVLIGFTLFMFTVTYILPGDPIRALFGFVPPPPDVYAELNAHYGLDQPFWVQYFRYVKNLFSLSLGESFQTGQSVNGMIAEALPISLRLLAIALVGQVVIGIGIAALAVRRKRSIIDTAVNVTTMLIVSIPVFVLAGVAQTIVGAELRWLPVEGSAGWSHYVMPGFVMAISLAAFLARVARSEVSGIMESPYIRAARGNGLSEGRIVLAHALRPSLTPLVTLVAASVSQMVAGLLLVETVFSMPGLGGIVYQAIGARDQPVVLGVLFVVTIAVLVANLIADVALSVFDPRIRLE